MNQLTHRFSYGTEAGVRRDPGDCNASTILAGSLTWGAGPTKRVGCMARVQLRRYAGLGDKRKVQRTVTGWRAGETPAENARAVTPPAARPVPYLHAV